MFAKLYEGTPVGQLLVKIDEGDDGPEVRFFFEPKGMGVCSMAIQFKDDDSGDAWDNADKAFALMDEENAFSAIKPIVAKLGLAG